MSANVDCVPAAASPLLAGSVCRPSEAIPPSRLSSQNSPVLDQLGSGLQPWKPNLNTDSVERVAASGEILGWEAVMQPLHHLGDQLR